MRNLGKRLDALEADSPAAFRQWHRVVQDVGQSREDAIASYEAIHGSIGEDNVILRVVM